MAMASPSERSSSSRSTTSLMPGRIVVACDATRNFNSQEFKQIISNIQTRQNMIQEVDTITVLGVLHKVLHPMGFQMQIGPDSFIGTRVRAIKEEVTRMVDAYAGKLQNSAEECEGSGVVIEVKIVVGAPLKNVIVQEAIGSNATWVVLNRHLRKELKFYLNKIPCKVAQTLDNFSLKILRPFYSDKAMGNIEPELFYSLSKLVSVIPSDYTPSNDHSLISPIYRGSTSSHRSSGSDRSSFVSSLTSKSKEQNIFSPDEFTSNSHLEKPGIYAKRKEHDSSPPVKLTQSLQSDPSFAIPCSANGIISRECKHSEIQIVEEASSSGDLRREDTDEDSASDDSYPEIEKQINLQLDFHVSHHSAAMKMHLGSKIWNYSEIQTATNGFSSENLLGEDGYGLVYKGLLKDGQLIAVKVQKEANTQGYLENYLQLGVLSLACHKNVVMLLGYCRRENINILVYEYICDRSLEWYLFDNKEHVLAWHQRRAIAIGIAKGLRFLHEECRGSPILHRDMRPSNICLTHEFIPLLADCGLVKWNTNDHNRHTKFQGTLEYLAPEYAENNACSVKTDVFAFGIILIQLISGCKCPDSTKDSPPQSLREWAMPLIEMLKLDELVDPRLGDSYGMYELYQMARVAYLCVQTEPAMRPTAGEVLLILEGENEHLDQLTEQLIPVPNNVQRRVYPQVLKV
ncbi:serine/threonine-protein kinase PBL34-like isoform X2 [Salvia miltiorrhiza]|uniref:serine/threonine-protein kinase PBL34-like isoform X2 n=1 Tax=Salvia miltiorrhiza TaxID=226208 RepID=UPI0025AD3F0A|nr:serine/threonine-protein kinase PBL34-like isoform X2 [Salvia miltiorrhiza]